MMRLVEEQTLTLETGRRYGIKIHLRGVLAAVTTIGGVTERLQHMGFYPLRVWAMQSPQTPQGGPPELFPDRLPEKEGKTFWALGDYVLPLQTIKRPAECAMLWLWAPEQAAATPSNVMPLRPVVHVVREYAEVERAPHGVEALPSLPALPNARLLTTSPKAPVQKWLRALAATYPLGTLIRATVEDAPLMVRIEEARVIGLTGGAVKPKLTGVCYQLTATDPDTGVSAIVSKPPEGWPKGMHKVPEPDDNELVLPKEPVTEPASPAAKANANGAVADLDA